MSNKRKRFNYEEQTVLGWMYEGETYAEAKKRLDLLWQQGQHPVQLKEKDNA